jgi:hypothetical protein
MLWSTAFFSSTWLGLQTTSNVGIFGSLGFFLAAWRESAFAAIPAIVVK